MGAPIASSREKNGDTLAVYRRGSEAVVVRERGNGKPPYVAATLPIARALSLIGEAA